MRRSVGIIRGGVILAVGGVLLWRMLSTYGGGGYSERWDRKGDLPTVAPLLGSAGTNAADRAILDSLAVIVTNGTAADEGPFTADVAITNGSSAMVKDVVIECEGLGSSGAHIGQTTATLAAPVRPHHTSTTARFPLPFLQRNVMNATCTARSFHQG
jgi:hypothetical protein